MGKNGTLKSRTVDDCGFFPATKPDREKRGREAYGEWRADQRSKGQYHVIPIALLAFYGPEKAALIACLASTGEYKGDENGWVWASPSFIEGGTGINRQRQREVIDALKLAGVLDEKTDDDRRRLLRLNLSLIKGA